MRKIFTIINRGYISHRHLLGSREDDSVAKHWRECERDFNGIRKSSGSKGIWNFRFLYSKLFTGKETRQINSSCQKQGRFHF